MNPTPGDKKPHDRQERDGQEVAVAEIKQRAVLRERSVDTVARLPHLVHHVLPDVLEDGILQFLWLVLGCEVHCSGFDLLELEAVNSLLLEVYPIPPSINYGMKGVPHWLRQIVALSISGGGYGVAGRPSSVSQSLLYWGYRHVLWKVWFVVEPNLNLPL